MSLLPEFIQPILESPWALVLLPIMFWFYINYKSLTSYKDHPESFQQAIVLLKEDRFGKFYRILLGKVLDKVSGWLGDKERFKPRLIFQEDQGHKVVAYNRFFSINPFSPQSYEFVLRLAFVYPILSYLIMWGLGSNVRIIGYYLSNISSEQRGLIILLTLIIPIIFLFLILRRKLLTQWLLLIFLSVLTVFFGTIELANTFWVMFLSLFIPCYIIGGSIAWLVHGHHIIAHQTIYRFAFTFSIALVIAFIGAAAIAIVDVVNNRAIDSLDAVTRDDEMAMIKAFTGAMYVAFAATGAVVGAVVGAVGSTATLIAVITFFIFMVTKLADDKSIIAADFTMGFNPDVFISISISIGIGIIVASTAFVLLNRLQKYSEYKKSSYLFWFFYTIILLVTSFIFILNINDRATIGLLLFYLILPFVNAPLDWISLGITRGLLHSIYHEYHSSWQAFTWALFDLMLAVFFLFAVSALLVFTVGMVDHIGNQNFLRFTLDRLSKPETAKAYYWIHAMLLTTLIPTLVHFAIAGTSLVMWLPQQGRHWMANNLKGNLYKIWAASFYLTFTPIIGLLAPIALLYGLYLLVTAHGGWLGGVLLDWANLLAGVIV